MGQSAECQWVLGVIPIHTQFFPFLDKQNVTQGNLSRGCSCCFVAKGWNFVRVAFPLHERSLLF